MQENPSDEFNTSLLTENPELPGPTPVSNDFVDKMTLELLMNKNHYNRYTAQTNPKRFAEIKEYAQNIQTYREPILEITHELMQNPQKQITTDVNEAFDQYMKSMIRYFKMKELENQPTYNRSNGYGADEEDDTLFGKMEDRQSDIQRSFWSKERVSKKSGFL